MLMLMLFLMLELVRRVLVWRVVKITTLGRHMSRTTCEVHVDTAGIFLGGVLETLLATDLFDSGFEFLDVICRVDSLSDNPGQDKTSKSVPPSPSKTTKPGNRRNIHMQMPLPMTPGIPNPLLKNILRLLNELTVEIDRIRRNPALGVILAKDKLGGLLVVFFHFATVRFALFGELLGGGAVAIFVGFAGLHGWSLVSSRGSIGFCCCKGERNAPCENTSSALKPPVLLDPGGGRIPVQRHCFLHGGRLYCMCLIAISPVCMGIDASVSKIHNSPRPPIL